VPAALLCGAPGQARRAEAKRHLAHLESYVEGLEHALARTRREQDQLRDALASSGEQLIDATEALQRLHTSRISRYTRPARMFFYRARGR
jgi:septal ring factor EnvC (AmiA/AmiB activator)